MCTNVATLRRARCWTQEELADRAEVSRTQITRMEAGTLNPTLKTLRAVADALGVPIRALFAPEPHEAALAEISERFAALPEHRQKLAMQMLEALTAQER